MKKIILLSILIVPYFAIGRIGPLKELVVTDTAIFLNDQSIQFPLDLNELIDLMGKPRMREGNVNDLYIWNRCGLMCYCLHGTPGVTSIDIVFSYNWFANPVRLFNSNLVIDGIEVGKKYNKEDFEKIGYKNDRLPEYFSHTFGKFKILVEFRERKEKLIGISIDPK